MIRSIKTKLVIAISVLVILVLAVASYLLIQQKERELTRDIFVSTNAFAELSAPEIVGFYKLYLSENSFVFFNREIKKVFSKNANIDRIQIASYSGDLLYDSRTDRDSQYSGPKRSVSSEYVSQIKSQSPSIFIAEPQKGTYFLARDDDGILQIEGQDNDLLRFLSVQGRVSTIAYPYGNKFSVIYHLSYENLEASVLDMRNRIILLAVFAICLGFSMAWLMAGRITKPIRRITEGAENIARGNFRTRVPVRGDDETSVLAKTFNKMAEDLDKSTKALVYRERVGKELELAAKIQKDLLPREMPRLNGLDICAGLLPAEEIGGDCYDFVSVDGKNWLFYVGDVTGHGVPSGIVVSVANAIFYSSAGEKELKEILVEVNRVLKEKTRSNMFLTLVLLHWDEETGVMKYVSAGHEPVIHYHADTKTTTECEPGGIALGMFPDLAPHLQVREIELKKDDVLVLYTDGILEAWKNEQEMYGMARFKKAIDEYSDLPSSIAIRNALLANVKDFTGKYKQEDDITVMVIKRK